MNSGGSLKQNPLDRLEEKRKPRLVTELQVSTEGMACATSSQKVSSRQEKDPDSPRKNWRAVHSDPEPAVDTEYLTSVNDADTLIPDTPSPVFSRKRSREMKPSPGESPVFPSVRPKVMLGQRSHLRRRSKSSSPATSATVDVMYPGGKTRRWSRRRQCYDLKHSPEARGSLDEEDVVHPSKKHKLARNKAWRRFLSKAHNRTNSATYFDRHDTDELDDAELGVVTLTPIDSSSLLPPLTDHLQAKGSPKAYKNTPATIDLTASDDDSSDIAEEDWERQMQQSRARPPQSLTFSPLWNPDTLLNLSDSDEFAMELFDGPLAFTQRKKSHSDPQCVRRNWSSSKQKTKPTLSLPQGATFTAETSYNYLGAPETNQPIHCSHRCSATVRNPVSQTEAEHENKLEVSNQYGAAVFPCAEGAENFHRNIQDSDEDNIAISQSPVWLPPRDRNSRKRELGGHCPRQEVEMRSERSEIDTLTQPQESTAASRSFHFFPTPNSSTSEFSNQRSHRARRDRRNGHRFFTSLGLQTPTVTNTPDMMLVDFPSPELPANSVAASAVGGDSVPATITVRLRGNEHQCPDSTVTVPSYVNQGVSQRPRRSRDRRSRQAAASVRSPETTASLQAPPTSTGPSADHQLASDEAFARRLQAEMDLEFAASLVTPVRQTPAPLNLSAHAARSHHSAQLLPPSDIVQPEVNALMEHNMQIETRHGRNTRDQRQGQRVAATNQLSPVRLPTRIPVHRPAGVRGRSRRNRSRVWSPEALEVLPNQEASFYSTLLETHGLGARRRLPGNRGPLFTPPHDGGDYDQLWELADRLGDVKSRGLRTEQLQLLPVRSFKPAELKADKEAPECLVCMSEYEANQQLRILPCFHEYHADCIDRWLKNNASCPVCRVEVKIE